MLNCDDFIDTVFLECVLTVQVGILVGLKERAVIKMRFYEQGVAELADC
jgi:hypothetical protein